MKSADLKQGGYYWYRSELGDWQLVDVDDPREIIGARGAQLLELHDTWTPLDDMPGEFVGPIRPPSAQHDTVKVADPRIEPDAGDTLRAGASRVTVIGVSRHFIAGASSVQFYCQPALEFKGEPMDHGEFDLKLWRDMARDWTVESVGSRAVIE